MTRQFIKPFADARLDRPGTTLTTGVSYQRRVAAPRALFATPPVDLLTLVIADEIKRRAQAEVQREALRDAVYDMPVSRERNDHRGADIDLSDSDE